MKRLLKYFGRFLLLQIFGTIILLIAIYVSSLSEYTEEQFNIPKDFFVREVHPDEHKGREKFLKLGEFIRKHTLGGEDKTVEGKIDFQYLRIKADCSILKNKYRKDCNTRLREHKESILKKYPEIQKIGYEKYQEASIYKLQDIKFFVNLKMDELETLHGADLRVLVYWENGDDSRKIGYRFWDIRRYIHGITYLAYDYAEQGKVEKAVKMLLRIQKNINHLYNVGNSDAIGFVYIDSFELMLINALGYIVENYNVSNTLKNEIVTTVSQGDKKSFLKKVLVNEHHAMMYGFDRLYKYGIHGDPNFGGSGRKSLMETITISLFYSLSEVKAIYKQVSYEYITTGKSEFYDTIIVQESFLNHLSNRLGRYLLMGSGGDMESVISDAKKNQQEVDDFLQKLK